MLEELIDIFTGMYIYALDAIGASDYEFKDYFTSMLCLVVTMCIMVGSFLVICTIISETFKTIRGTTK